MAASRTYLSTNQKRIVLMSDYRWNSFAAARAFDVAAEHVHPHYADIQEQILSRLLKLETAGPLVVDVGGGSGRLMERILDNLPDSTGFIVDQSEPFLALAAERLSRFGSRATLLRYRLQDDWGDTLPGHADAIVSKSAIHHLVPDEKRALYAQCCEHLSAEGVFINADEIRPESDEKYLEELSRWAEHMQTNLRAGIIPESFAEIIFKWQQRNIEEFDRPKQSGDDCHETADVQVDYLREAGFHRVSVEWQKQMWAVITAER